MNKISFPKIFSNSSTSITLDINAINENIKACLLCNNGELLGDPEYGCNLIERIFMYNGVLIQKLIKEDIIEAVNKYEPRIFMNENDISIVHHFIIIL